MDVTPARPVGGPGSFFIVDSYNFVFRAYHALPMLNAPDGRPVNAVHGFARMVQALRREFQPECFLAVFDAGGDGGRKAVFAGYKQQRPPPPPDIVPQFPMVREATAALGIACVEHPNYEADDLIASYTTAAMATGMRVVIVSSDKDLMQLCTLGAEGRGSVLLWDTMKNKTVGPAEVIEKFGVEPSRLGDLLALTGDSSDNIPGVEGIGPKTAAALLTEFGDLEGVLAGASQIKQTKRRERLIEDAPLARLSRQLVELHRDLPLPKPIAELVDHGFDERALADYFEPLGFRQLLREAGTRPSGRTREETAERSANEPPPGPEDALELLPVAGFRGEPERYRTLSATDAQAWTELLAAAAHAPMLAVGLCVPAGDPLVTEPVGIGLCAANLAPTYVPFGHRQADLVDGPQLARDQVVAGLAPILADPNHPKIIFDGKTTSHALGRLGIGLRGVVLDPMLASYTLDPARTAHSLESLAKDILGHELPTETDLLGRGRKSLEFQEAPPSRVGPWIAERTFATFAVGTALQQQLEAARPSTRALLADLEMPLCEVLVRLEARGVLLDTTRLAEQSAVLAETVAILAEKVAKEAGHPVNLDSPLQLQKLLFEERGLPPSRKIKTGFSTDAQVLEELSALDPLVRDILEYRTAIKLKNTYLDALPQLVRPGTGRLHTSFNQAVASTGRLSSSDPNLQNIPIRTVEGRRIREAFIAPPGRMLVALDYSQIELRILAHLSGDPNLTSAFRDGVDVHRRTAAEVFEVSEDQVDDEQRRIAKAVNFGVVYGQTEFGLAQQLGIPRGKAGLYKKAYFKKIPGVERYMKDLIEIAKARGYAETILGRRRRIPELRSKGAARAHGERIARNTPIQGSAADILKIAMIQVDRALRDVDWAAMLLTVHDELIFECDEARVDELIGLCRPLMESAVPLSVPLAVDAGHGPSWAACKR